MGIDGEEGLIDFLLVDALEVELPPCILGLMGL
jgi:hypothetical protein